VEGIPFQPEPLPSTGIAPGSTRKALSLSGPLTMETSGFVQATSQLAFGARSVPTAHTTTGWLRLFHTSYNNGSHTGPTSFYPGRDNEPSSNICKTCAAVTVESSVKCKINNKAYITSF